MGRHLRAQRGALRSPALDARARDAADRSGDRAARFLARRAHDVVLPGLPARRRRRGRARRAPARASELAPGGCDDGDPISLCGQVGGIHHAGARASRNRGWRPRLRLEVPEVVRTDEQRTAVRIPITDGMLAAALIEEEKPIRVRPLDISLSGMAIELEEGNPLEIALGASPNHRPQARLAQGAPRGRDPPSGRRALRRGLHPSRWNGPPRWSRW